METERLKLRQWIPSDRKFFIELNSDPEVMEYFPNLLSVEESNSLLDMLQSGIKENGWGFWAVELKSNNSFIGTVGLNSPTDNLPFNPCVEVGWRLAKEYWGSGYATEAAHEALKYAFEDLSLNEVVSFTTIKNFRSQSVMQRINMSNANQNFVHPAVPVGNELQEHVLFKITQEQWASASSNKAIA